MKVSVIKASHGPQENPCYDKFVMLSEWFDSKKEAKEYYKEKREDWGDQCAMVRGWASKGDKLKYLDFVGY